MAHPKREILICSEDDSAACELGFLLAIQTYPGFRVTQCSPCDVRELFYSRDFKLVIVLGKCAARIETNEYYPVLVISEGVFPAWATRGLRPTIGNAVILNAVRELSQGKRGPRKAGIPFRKAAVA